MATSVGTKIIRASFLILFVGMPLLSIQHWLFIPLFLLATVNVEIVSLQLGTSYYHYKETGKQGRGCLALARLPFVAFLASMQVPSSNFMRFPLFQSGLLAVMFVVLCLMSNWQSFFIYRPTFATVVNTSAPTISRKVQILAPDNRSRYTTVETESPFVAIPALPLNTCLTCKEKPITNTRHSVCESCQSRYQNIIQQINAQCYRARKYNLPATLTLPQWLAKLEHFSNHCAYCLNNPAEVIEHYKPVGKNGGGTTNENCLPACRSCNSEKSNKLPE